MKKEIVIQKEKVMKSKIKEVPEYLKDMPNQKAHKIVSFIKSTLRMAACMLGVFTSVEMGFIVLGIAEVVGVIEEMV